MTEVLYERRGAAAWLTLNRPQAMNALSPGLMTQLAACLERARADAAVRAVVLTGAGRAFCAGADLIGLPHTGSLGETTRAFIDVATPVVNTIKTFPKPVIAAVNGLALAGGLELILACDLVVAASSARLGDAHANFGLVPAGGASVRLPRQIGSTRAKFLIMTGDFVQAEELQAAGLINLVVPVERLTAAVDELVAKLAAKSPRSLRIIKEMVDGGLALSEDEAIVREADLAVAHCDSHDAREGVAAFAAKRTPHFTGE